MTPNNGTPQPPAPPTPPLYDPAPVIRITLIIIALPLIASVILAALTHNGIFILAGLAITALTAAFICPVHCCQQCEHVWLSVHDVLKRAEEPDEPLSFEWFIRFWTSRYCV